MSFFGRRKRERAAEPADQLAGGNQGLMEALRRAAPDALAEGPIVDFASQSLDDDSLRAGYLVVTRERLLWGFAPEAEIQTMDIRQGVRLNEDEQLAPDFARLIEVASNGHAATFLIPRDSGALRGLDAIARPSAAR